MKWDNECMENCEVRVRAPARVIGLLVVVLALGVVFGAAGAHAAPPSNAPSAADQYVEQIPTDTGSTAVRPSDRDHAAGSAGGGSAGPGGGGGGGADGGAVAPLPLSSPAQRRLDALDSATARQLKELATSPELGAPLSTLRADRTQTQSDKPSLAGAVLSAASGGEGRDSVLTWLLIAIAVTTIVSLAAARYERRAHSRTGPAPAP